MTSEYETYKKRESEITCYIRLTRHTILIIKVFFVAISPGTYLIKIVVFFVSASMTHAVRLIFFKVRTCYIICYLFCVVKSEIRCNNPPPQKPTTEDLI